MARRIGVFAVCGLVLGACGIGKMSPKETEAELNRTYPGPDWRCIKGDHGWDYVCGKIGLTDAQLRQQGIGVKVDWDSVTARTAP
jgi:predicted molibdopterin-dependent oxidoreductase YjgC